VKNGILLVNYSTDYIFSGKCKKGYKETDTPDPINNYGRSKLLGEQEIIKLSGKGLKWYLVRPSKLFGPKGNSDLVKPSFFDIMLKLGKEKDELKVVDEETSCFTFTIDLAKATKELVESDKGYGIYHITNSSPATWYGAVKELFDMAGITNVKVIPVKGDEFPRPARRPKYSILLSTKLQPLRDYREALKEYLNK